MGPRYWQAIEWYRWIPLTFSKDFAMMISIVGGRPGGMVLEGDEYHLIRDCTTESDCDDRDHQTAMRCTVTTDHATYEMSGEVISLIPLRNRRQDLAGNELLTRTTEAMTRFECRGQKGIGMSEYLDQIVERSPRGARRPLTPPLRSCHGVGGLGPRNHDKNGVGQPFRA